MKEVNEFLTKQNYLNVEAKAAKKMLKEADEVVDELHSTKTDCSANISPNKMRPKDIIN